MSWPNLTLVPEGDITRAIWLPDRGRALGPVRFVSVGDAWLRPADASEGLATLLYHVLDRLAEAGLPKTRLAEEWTAVADADEHEAEFCHTVAQMGLDPYAVDDETAAAILAANATIPPELSADFFDNADPDSVGTAAQWTQRALGTAVTAATKARNRLTRLRNVVDALEFLPEERPWAAGYRMARQVRDALNVPSVGRFDISPWVGMTRSSRDPGGIPGIVAVSQGRCGLVQGSIRTGFAQARALGRVLLRPGRHSFILSATRGYDERVAGAFAAELLAPAEGVRQALDALGGRLDDAALDAVARGFAVSPLVIRHQYENQLAGSAGW